MEEAFLLSCMFFVHLCSNWCVQHC
ncbi:hypothetical protein Nmel_000991 [Mimus melanotis]